MYTGEPCACSKTHCADCAFNNVYVHGSCCKDQRKAWAKSEYKEKPKYGMLNADLYKDLIEIIDKHTNNACTYCATADCADCPYNHSANCRELVIIESMILDGWTFTKGGI
jgi:hypothetical protein